MKLKTFSPVIALVVLGAAFSAQAHDPKEHMKNAEKPDCAAMKDMDHSKMDMKDPVVQAMMKKCMKAMHDHKDMHHHDDEHEASEHEHQNDQDSSDEQDPQHQHSDDQHSDDQH